MKNTMLTFIFAALLPVSSFAAGAPNSVDCDSSGQTRDLQAMLKKMKAQWSLMGEASYYGEAFRNRRTSNGEKFDPDNRTAAMTVYRDKCVTVRNLRTNQQAYVWVNDNGPHARDKRGRPRVIDLSTASKDAIGARTTEDVEVLPTAKRNCASISPRARN